MNRELSGSRVRRLCNATLPSAGGRVGEQSGSDPPERFTHPFEHAEPLDDGWKWPLNVATLNDVHLALKRERSPNENERLTERPR